MTTHIGRISEMRGSVGDVVVDGTNTRTIIFAEDCRRAGIEPKPGTRLIYSIGARPGTGVTCAIGLERLGGAPAATTASPAQSPAAPVLSVVPKPPATPQA
jgi:hypothetical protein